MHIKKPLLLITLLASQHAASQEKFIEVIVSDTAWVKPNQFVYSIWVNPLSADDSQDTVNNFSNFQKKQAALKATQQLLLDSVRNLVFKKGFVILPVNIHYAYSTEAEGRLKSVDVLTSTTDSVALLYNLIDNNVNLTGRVSSVSSSNEDVCQRYLLKKLVNKAVLKAAEIAKLSGVKLGNIISVNEAASDSKYVGWTAYPPRYISTSMEPGWIETNAPRGYSSDDKPSVNGLYLIENRLVVRFSAQ